MREHARRYLTAGLCVVPASATTKTPLVSWADYQDKPPRCVDDFTSWPRIALICGHVSGGMEVLDFDGGGVLYDEWRSLVSPGLLSRLVVQRTPSGGLHVLFRSSGCGRNAKLAMRGKQCLIETRGQGGLILVAPSEGYELVQGDPALTPVIDAAEREQLIRAARSLGDPPAHKPRGNATNRVADEERPGDRYNAETSVADILRRHGWVYAGHAQGNDRWRRPGKEDRGHSATVKNGLVYVWSSNAWPLEPDRTYDAFGLMAALEHGGDHQAATEWLVSEGYGDQEQPSETVVDGVDLSGILHSANRQVKPTFPRECLDDLPALLRVALDYTLESSVKPQPELSLAALVACFGALLGRRVRDDYDTRTNVMLLGLAPSGAGKEHPRQICKRILADSGCSHVCGPERIGSHAGVVSSLVSHPCRLFQIDEIGRLLSTMGSADKSPHLYNIGTVLMQLYSSANTLWTGDAYADQSKVKQIDQPCLCVFGTSTPETFYGAIRPENLTDGLLGRMLIIEGEYGRRQKPQRGPVPQEILDAIAAWQDLAGGGNLDGQHPRVRLIPKTPEADETHERYCEEVHARHASDDSVAAALWARAPEKAAKLALIYACCDCRPGVVPTITAEAVQWGKRIANYSNRLTLYAARQLVSDSHFEKQLKRVFHCFDLETTRREIQRRCKGLKVREVSEILSSLEEQGLVTVKRQKNQGARASVVVRKTGLQMP